jgi:predicted hydrocarbon binding protein
MLRENLGEFISIVCFQGVVTGMKDALGEKATNIALTAAGRTRGKNLVKSLGLSGANIPLEDIASKLDLAVGKEGTRLCMVDKVEDSGDKLKVYVKEAVCSAGMPQDSALVCSYTLGALWGAIEEVGGKRYQGKQVEFTTQGAAYEVFELTAMG